VRPSPLQNRVRPTGEIVATPARGLLLGNRGCLHGHGHELGVSRWRSKMWICCVLDWKDVRRDPMPPGRWTALFFLDEATSLAAGHRPCAYCRRADFLWYARSWGRAFGLPDRGRAPDMDARLHAERVVSRTRQQRTRVVPAGSLPDGVMVDAGTGPALLLAGTVRPWRLDGYGAPVDAPTGPVELLTPPATVATIAAGYQPLVHPTAKAPAGAAVRTLE
jgi:hypothetical protein